MTAGGAAVDGANAQGQTPLMWASMDGNTDTIKWLLAHGAKVNAADKKGFTPIFFALRSKIASAPTVLLDAGADVNVIVADGTSVVQAAITTENIPFAIQAVSHGADLHRADKQGRQLIHLAAISGDAEFIKMVLSKGGDPNASTNPAPAAPRPAAAGAANPNAAIDAAIAQRRALNFAPPRPSTPLQLAANAGSVPAMKALVEAGAKPDEKTDDGMTVAMAAAGSGIVEAMEYAYQIDPHLDVIARGGRSIMHIAVAARGTPDPIGVIQYLVDKGAPLAVQDARKASPGDNLNTNGDPVIREFYIKLLRDRGIVSENH
jgi:ankyrin repeat protein